MDLEKAAYAACYASNYCMFPEEKRRELFEKQKPFWTDVAKAVLAASSIVNTVYVSGDESNHIFSTPELAQAFADKQETPCVLSEYMIDSPERYYGVQQ